MKLVKIKDIEIPIMKGPIGINCSGGADSSLLLYILMSNTTDLVHIFTIASDLKGRTTATITAKVIEKIVQLTGNSNIEHHVCYVKNQTNENVAEIPLKYVKKNLITYWYSGLTANPSKELTESFGKITDHHLRDPLIKRNIVNQNIKKITPFTNIDKKTIAQLYKEQNLLETLFPLTRSCEIESKIDYYDHCGSCWWCRERLWAFSEVINKK